MAKKYPESAKLNKAMEKLNKLKFSYKKKPPCSQQPKKHKISKKNILLLITLFQILSIQLKKQIR